MHHIKALIGKTAPNIVLSAIVTGRDFNLANLAGTPVLLLFVDHKTGRISREVLEPLRQKYPNHNQIHAAIVIDLRIVPRLLRSTAHRIIESSFKEAVTQIPGNFDPADQLIMLPDWNGDVYGAFGIGDVNQDLMMVLIDAEGKIREIYQGPDPGQTVIDLVSPYIISD